MRPDFSVSIGGNDITAALRSRVLSIEVTDEAEEKSDTASIELDNRPENGRYMDLPEMGASVAISLGYRGHGLTLMGQYEVDSVDVGFSTVMVGCKAAKMNESFRSPKTQSWFRRTLGAIAQEIAGRNGYTPVINGDLGEILVSHAEQYGESDMAFLTRLTEEHDAVARPTNGRLVIAKRRTGQSASGQTLPSITITPDMCLGEDGFSYGYGGREDGGKSGGLPGSETRTEPGGFRTYYYDLKAAEKVAVTAGPEPYREIATTYRNKIAAEAAANAFLNQKTRSAARLGLTVIGNPAILAEAKIQLSGFQPGIPVEWFARSVVHSIGSGGFTTQLTCEPYLVEQKDVASAAKAAAAAPASAGGGNDAYGWVGEYTE